MNKKLQKFLEIQKIQEIIDYEEEKEKTLVKSGLYEKEYSDSAGYSKKFPYFDWGSKTSSGKFYRKIPIEVTDEEYKEVKRYANKHGKNKNNPIAIAITVIALLTILGGIISVFVFDFMYFCIGLISGTMLLGCAEIIRLLYAIKKK